MNNEDNFIILINSLLQNHENIATEYSPITKKKIEEDSKLCNLLIDFLGDIYVTFGFGKNYNKTKHGEILSKLIDYLAELNRT